MTRKTLIAATAMALFTSGAYAATADTTQGAAGTTTQSTATTKQANEAAVQACSEELTRVNEEIGAERFGTRNRDVRTLHEAAMIFARNGQTEACQRVAEGMKSYMQSASAGAIDRTGDPFKERIENARPLDEMEGTMRLSELIGADVVSTNGETLGDVDDVVMSPGGDTRYLLVGTGGFLSLGEEYVPVKTDEVRVIDRNTLVLDVPETAFQDAPRFNMDTIESKAEQWTNDIAAWWDRNVTRTTR